MAKRRLFLCKHAHRGSKIKAMLQSARPHRDPTLHHCVLMNIRASKHSLISYLRQQSKLTPVLWKRTFKKCIFAGVFRKQAPWISQTFTSCFSRFLLHICLVSNCRYIFYLCSALVISTPVLFVPYCFLILCHFCFSSLPRFIQLVINGSIHAEFVVNKTFISVTQLSAVSLCLHICLP